MYKLTSGNMVIDLSYGDGASRFVPIVHEEYQQWLSEGNIPEPEFTYEELAQQEFSKRKQEALSYLADTAWYIERLSDPSSGKEIPEEVLTKRAEAREILNELKGVQV